MRAHVLLVLGLLAGGLAIIAWPPLKNASRTVTVLVPIEDIQPGTIVKEPDKLFTFKRLRAETAPRNFLTDFKQVRNLQTVRSVAAQMPCTDRDFSSFFRDSKPTPSPYTAVTIRVSKTQLDLLRTGSRVDVRFKEFDDEEMEIRSVVLDNVRVLLINDPIGSICIAVKLHDAKRVVDAAETGTLSVVERKRR